MNGFMDFVKNNKGLVLGVTAGLVTGILLLTLGFFPTLLLWVCIVIGGIIGSNGAAKRWIVKWLDSLLPKIFK